MIGRHFQPQARSLLVRSFLLPLQHPKKLIKLFWPTYIILALGFLRWTIGNSLGSWAGTAFVIVLWLTLFPITAARLIHWHRWCVLGVPIPTFELNFGKREWTYWLFWLEIGAWMLVCFLIVGTPVLLLSFVLIGFHHSQHDGWTMWLTILMAFALATIMFAKWCGFYSLRFVGIAIDEPERGWAIANSGRELSNYYPWFWQLLAIILFVSSLLGDFGRAPMKPAQMQLSEAIAVSASWTFMLFGYVVFATALSLFYREHLAKERGENPERP